MPKTWVRWKEIEEEEEEEEKDSWVVPAQGPVEVN